MTKHPQITDVTRGAGWNAFVAALDARCDGPQIYAQTIDAVAPLIVADELEGLAHEMSMRTVTEEDVRARIAQLRSKDPGAVGRA
jgi:hypothetical protein